MFRSASSMTGQSATDTQGLLRRNDAYRNLFLAYSTSDLASQIVRIFLPLAALTLLGASALQVGILAATLQLPYLLFSLHVGAWSDRRSSKSLLVIADATRAAIFVGLLMLLMLDALTFPVLLAAAFVIGSCTVFFDIASQAYLPAIVPTRELASANGLLESARSITTMAGPALAGILVQIFAGAAAAATTAALYVLSTSAARRIREVDNDVVALAGVSASIRDGLSLVFHNPVLAWMAGLGGLYNLLFTGYMVVSIVFFVDTLNLTAAQVGVVLGALGPGFLLGSVFAARLARRLGFGWAILLTAVVSNAAIQAVPFVSGNSTVTLVILVAVHVAFAAFNLAHAVLMRTVRQLVTPIAAQGRVAATNRLVAQGTTPVGALALGWLATEVGPRSALLATTLGFLAIVLLLTLSPIRSAAQALEP